MRNRVIVKSMAALVAAAVLLPAVIGCGGSSPSAAAEEFLAAGKDKNCEKMVEMIDFSTPQAQSLNKDELVQSCKAESALGDVESYKVLEEKVEGDKATVKVEVTTNSDGQQNTESDTFILYNRDGVWKLSLE